MKLATNPTNCLAKSALFEFPKDLRNKWMKRIPRANWTLNECHRVCAKHLHEDFEKTFSDKPSGCRNNRELLALKRLWLKTSAVPCIFEGLPQYLSADFEPLRSTITATSSARCGADNRQQVEQNKILLTQDEFHDIESLKAKLSTAILPTEYFTCSEQESINFILLLYLIQKSEDIAVAPKMKVFLTISNLLELSVFVNSAPIAKSSHKHLIKSDNIKTVSELSNVLAFCKAL